MSTVYFCSVLTRMNSAQKILSHNAELSARLKLAERLAAERATQLEALKKEVEQLQAGKR